jgi:hypothetical protein
MNNSRFAVVPAFVAGALAVTAAAAQMPANCPMHAEHTAKAAAAEHPAEHAHAAAASATSPYVGEQDRPIAGLSADRLEALRAGTGHGMALPAELNHYPGPRHLLDLGAAVGLRDEQATALRPIFESMHERAVDLGAEIIAAERALDRLFADGKADNAAVIRSSARIAALEGELRAAHLLAHVEARALLDAEQITRYDAARGYAAGAE